MADIELFKKPVNINRISYETIRGLLQWSPEQFNQLKVETSEEARRHLDIQVPWQNQRVDNWRNFKSAIFRRFPELERYEKHWPLECLARRFLRWSIRRRRAKLPSSMKQTALQTSRKTTVQRVFVGKTPPPLRCFSSHPKPIDGGGLMNRQGKDKPEGVGCASTGSHNARPVNVPQYNSNLEGNENQAPPPPSSKTYPTVCLFCEHIPIVTPTANREIVEILQGAKAAVRSLASLGIVNDCHLHILRKWGTVDFFQSLPPHTLGALHKAIFIKYLTPTEMSDSAKTTSDSHTQICTPSSGCFPQPPREVEKHLTSADSSANALGAAMGVDGEMFQIFTRTVDEKMTEEWPSLDMNDDGESTETHWGSLVNKICIECPSVKNYENKWPILFYVQWRRERLRFRRSLYPLLGKADGGSMPLTSNSSPSRWVPILCYLLHEQGIPWSGCPVHSSSSTDSTSPRVEAVLQVFGMKELMPLFLAVQIRSDDDFKLLFMLSEEERLSVLNVGCYKLRPFQKMMLNIVLKELLVSDRS